MKIRNGNNTYASKFRRPNLQTRPANRLSLLKFVIVFVSSAIQMSKYYLIWAMTGSFHILSIQCLLFIMPLYVTGLRYDVMTEA